MTNEITIVVPCFNEEQRFPGKRPSACGRTSRERHSPRTGNSLPVAHPSGISASRIAAVSEVDVRETRNKASLGVRPGRSVQGCCQALPAMSGA